jgi:serine-type D-Ala-D-Ala carboxypeptidase (penicillin-binding protein 5/6)
MNLRPNIIFNIEKRTKAFPKLLLVLFAVSALSFSSLVSHKFPENAVVGKKPAKFEEPELTAKAAVVYDVNKQKVIYGKNADLPLPLASLTKVMTAITARKLAQDMNKVSIKLEDLAPEGDSGLKVASSWNTKDLIDYLLVVSSNDGARALAGAAAAWSKEDFVAQMNATAKEIGLSNAIFYNEHGLDRVESESGLSAGQAGSYGSAKDVAKLFEYALKNYPGILEATRYPELVVKDQENVSYIATNTNIAANLIPSLIASKTGYTNLAGGNLGVAFDAGLERPIIVIVLGSTQEGRFNDAVKLVQETIKYVSQE